MTAMMMYFSIFGSINSSKEFDTERVFLAKDLGLAALDEYVECFAQDLTVNAVKFYFWLRH